ncbi:MAG: transcriptional repressor LexA [Planctomycetales bacterium]
MSNLDRLTDKQRKIYEFIRDRIRTRGYGPTVREIGKGFGIKSPNGVMCHLKALEKKGLIKREQNMSRAITLVEESPQVTGLPLAGRIAAGALQEALGQDERIDFGELFRSEDMFVLEVRGESMIDDHIADGDYVVIRKQETARQGEIVVAITNDNEATLKRWFPEKDRIRLEPANSDMKPIYVDDARVVGVVVGVVRKIS